MRGDPLDRNGPSTRRSPWWTDCAVASLLAALPMAPARADDLSALFEPGTVVSVGGLLGAAPRFQGARRERAWGLPYASFRKEDEAPEWWSPDDGLDVALLNEGTVQAGAVLDLRDGRSRGDRGRLDGLPRLPLSVGLGVFGEVWPIADRLRLRAEVTQGIRPNDGVLAKLGADLVVRSGRFTLSGGPRLVIGDAAAQHLDFDVPITSAAADAALTPYRASAGLRSAGGAIALAYDWSRAWQWLGYVRGDRYVAGAAASPIVRRAGTETALSFGLGSVYTFRTGP